MIYRLADICTITKGVTGIMKAKPGEYELITLGEDNKLHNEFQFDAKAVIIALVSSTGHGHASMKRVKYFEGKFALGTILCAVIPKNDKIVNAKYLHIYLHENRDKLLVPLMKGAANVSLPFKKLDDVEVFIPSMEKQLEIVVLEQRISEKREQLNDFFEDQYLLLDKLRQTILQDAIQGKLTADWREQNPDVESASELLKHIKTEKAQLIKEKKIKKEKPLPPITNDEIPFDLPESWVWCRLGDIVQHNAGKTLHKGQNTGQLKDYITTSNLYWGKFELENIKQIKLEDKELDRCTAVKGDLLICEGGDVGRSAIWDKDYNICFQNHIHRVRPYSFIKSQYIYFYMMYLYHSKSILSYKKGMGIGNLSGTALSSITTPLPPISEQITIVDQIELLLEKCNQLSIEIENQKRFSQDLQKALFNEVFELKEKNAQEKISITETEPKIKTISLKPTNIDYYKRSVLAAEIVWQLHKEPTLGHLKLQKLIFLCQKTTNMQLATNFLRQAMGPYDNQLMRSIDKQLKDHKWFEYNSAEKLKYQPLEKAGEHHADYLKYFSSVVEIVATLYACMENILNEKNIIYSEGLLLKRFYEWSEEKQKFSEDEVKAMLKRMKEIGIVPDGLKN